MTGIALALDRIAGKSFKEHKMKDIAGKQLTEQCRVRIFVQNPSFAGKIGTVVATRDNNWSCSPGRVKVYFSDWKHGGIGCGGVWQIRAGRCLVVKS